MAVEIRELVIKAVITRGDNERMNNGQEATSLQNQQQLVQECVSQVMKIIRQSQNR